MANEKDPWFVVERSEALAGLLLTSRKDVKVRSERKTDEGVDLLVQVESDQAPSMRLFAVQVKGTVSSDRAEWLASVKHLFRAGSIFMPACVFVVNVRGNEAYYAWVAEPVAREDGAKLNFVTSPTFHDLTLEAVNDIVARVHAWYDALPAQLATASER